VSQQIRIIDDLIRPIVTQMGYDLWGIVYHGQGRHSVLRIYIEHADGITLDDCQNVSGQVSALLDVENPITAAYSLEISSPGLDRPLFTLEQYQRYIGQQVSIRLRTPQQNRRQFTGPLTHVAEDRVTLTWNGTELTLLFADIDKANLIPDL